jgi:site-specific recombinase XerD
MKSRTTPSHTPSLHLAQPGQHPADYFIQDFLHAKATKAPKTVQFYELGLRLYREHVGLHWPPTDSSINSFLAECKSRGCKDGTLHAYYRALKTWCNWLYKRGKIEENPISLVEEPPRGKKLPRAPRAADIEKLFEALEAAAVLGKWNHIRDLAIFGLMYETGIRVNEALTSVTPRPTRTARSSSTSKPGRICAAGYAYAMAWTPRLSCRRSSSPNIDATPAPGR